MSKGLHLKYSDLTRKIMNDKALISFQEFASYPLAKTKKEAYGYACLGLALAKRSGDAVSEEYISNCLNKLKGRNKHSSKEISHILYELSQQIPGQTKVGQEIKSLLETRSNKNMTKVVAETVLETMLPKGSLAEINGSSEGWKQLFVAIAVILGVKLWHRRF